jgi:hypothetical protein
MALPGKKVGEGGVIGKLKTAPGFFGNPPAATPAAPTAPARPNAGLVPAPPASGVEALSANATAAAAVGARARMKATGSALRPGRRSGSVIGTGSSPAAASTTLPMLSPKLGPGVSGKY